MKNVGLTTTTTKTLAAAELPADAVVAGNSATLAIAAVAKAGSVVVAKAVVGVASAAEVASEDGVAAESEVVVSFWFASSKINESVQLRQLDQEKKANNSNKYWSFKTRTYSSSLSMECGHEWPKKSSSQLAKWS